MKNLFTLAGRSLAVVALLAAGQAAQAQAQGVRIGAAGPPDASALLDLVSSTKGALLPRVATTADVVSPATGLVVFQTGGTPGYYYYTGTGWQQFATAAGAAITASNGLTKTGQNVALGGSLASPVTIAQAGSSFSLTGGNVGIGTATPQSTLDVSGDFRVSSGVVNATLGTTAPGTNNISGTALGQSFTMPVAGTVTSIRLLPNATFNTTFVFRAGSGNAGTVLSAPQPISFVQGAYSTVALTMPLALAAGVYTLVLNTGSNSMLYISSGDNYPGGNIYQGTAPISPFDLDFAISYSSGAATSAFNVGTSGNVGIGTTAAPSQKLEVAGGSLKISTAGQGLIFPDGSTQTTAAAPATGSGSYIQNTTNRQAGSSFNVSGSGVVGTSLGVGTSGAPTSTLQVAGTSAVGVVLGIPGGAGASGTLLASYPGGYLGLSPTGSSDNNFVLPAPASCVGRVYYLRNNSDSFMANVGTATGSILPASASTALGAGQPYQLRPDAASKTVIAISDGVNWTIGYIN